MLSEARKLFDFRMKAIKRFKHKMLKQIKGMRTSNMLKSSENADSQHESEAKKEEIDRYVNDPEIMAKKHWTPKIAKLKAAYFYSHHAAFKKMKEDDEKIRQDQNTASWVNWCIAMMCGGFVLLVLVLCIRRKRQAALGNIYDELAVQTSREQV